MAERPGFEPISREELYARAGKSTLALDRSTAIFTTELVGAVTAAMDKLGKPTATLRLINIAEDGLRTQQVEVILGNPDLPGGMLEVELKADFEKGQDRLLGAVPFYATYSGKFYRRENTKAEKPMAADGDLLTPPKPMFVGKASIRKGTYFDYEVDAEKFPRGVRVVQFLAPDIREGIDVVCDLENPDNSTILFYAVPL